MNPSSFDDRDDFMPKSADGKGRGLLDLIRERFGIAWTLFAIGIIVVAMLLRWLLHRAIRRLTQAAMSNTRT